MSFSGSAFASSISYNTDTWMSHLNNNTLLDQVIMPGSHDAGMSSTAHCTIGVSSSFVQTQLGDIMDQALSGVRYFDIRVDWDHNQLVTYHRSSGVGCNGESIHDVLYNAYMFVEHHPTEFIILKLSHTRNDSGHNPQDTDEAVVNKIKSLSYAKKFLYKADDTNLALMPIGDLRGKVIVVAKHNNDAHNKGTDDHYFQSLINPQAGIWGYQDKDQNPAGKTYANGLNVYDVYSDTSDLDQMKKDQLSKWNAFSEDSEHQNYLFLLSYTLTENVTHLDIKTLAERANKDLSAFLQGGIHQDGYQKPNVVYYDFTTKDQNKQIIDYNFNA